MATFGKMRGLWKVMNGCCEVLTLLESQQYQLATAYQVQLIKCLLQVALGHGDWSTAQLLLPWPDATARA
eukprot:6328350-Karenia_brevis.AAC.1